MVLLFKRDRGRNAARQPHWAAHNLLFHSALPPFEGRKAHTRELPAQVPPPRARVNPLSGVRDVAQNRIIAAAARATAAPASPSPSPTP